MAQPVKLLDRWRGIYPLFRIGDLIVDEVALKEMRLDADEPTVEACMTCVRPLVECVCKPAK